MTTATWLRGNPASQGYCLDEERLHELRFAVRFATALCLPLVVAAIVLESPETLIALAAVAVVAGVAPRHPFDLVWNRGVRYLVGGPELPPNPRRRRHAFKIGAVLLLVVAGLFVAGLSVPALVLGATLVIACTSATVLNFCVPSEALARLERRRDRKPLAA